MWNGNLILLFELFFMFPSVFSESSTACSGYVVDSMLCIHFDRLDEQVHRWMGDGGTNE